jgi:hypothetical protein
MHPVNVWVFIVGLQIHCAGPRFHFYMKNSLFAILLSKDVTANVRFH